MCFNLVDLTLQPSQPISRELVCPSQGDHRLMTCPRSAPQVTHWKSLCLNSGLTAQERFSPVRRWLRSTGITTPTPVSLGEAQRWSSNRENRSRNKTAFGWDRRPVLGHHAEVEQNEDTGQMWWGTAATPAFRRPGQENEMFKVSQGLQSQTLYVCM